MRKSSLWGWIKKPQHICIEVIILAGFFADFGGFLSILAVTTAKYLMVFKHELKGRLKEVEMLQLRHLKQ